METYQAIVAYDGTHYFGWQTTKMGPSIQETIALAIKKASQEEIIPEAASRTDRGVHAEGQSISFSLKKEWDPNRLIKAINAHLPKDIRILILQYAKKDFHPTLDAQSKQYHYKVSTSPFQEPIDRLYAWHQPKYFDTNKMRKAAEKMIGEKNFQAFSTQKAKNPICTLFSIGIIPEEKGLIIMMHGNRFLYKMARTIAGTLLDIGSGKLSVESVDRLFVEDLRQNGGVTAPPHGLFLHQVLY